MSKRHPDRYQRNYDNDPDTKKLRKIRDAAAVGTGALLLAAGSFLLIDSEEGKDPSKSVLLNPNVPEEVRRPNVSKEVQEGQKMLAEVDKKQAISAFETALESKNYESMRSNPGDLIVLGPNEEGGLRAIARPLIFTYEGTDYAMYIEQGKGATAYNTVEYSTDKVATFFLVDDKGNHYSEPLVVDGAHNIHASLGEIMEFGSPHIASQYVQEQAEMRSNAYFTSLGAEQ